MFADLTFRIEFLAEYYLYDQITLADLAFLHRSGPPSHEGVLLVHLLGGAGALRDHAAVAHASPPRGAPAIGL